MPKNKANLMAERMGFEPIKGLLLYTLSKRAPSTTRPPLLFKKLDNSFNTFSASIVCIDIGDRVTLGSISICLNSAE